jgi:hypothetical protein
MRSPTVAMPFIEFDQEQPVAPRPANNSKMITALLVAGVMMGAVTTWAVMRIMEIMKESDPSNNEPSCNADGSVALQYGQVTFNETLTNGNWPSPVMSTVVNLTCQQVLCNTTAIASTFMGYAWNKLNSFGVCPDMYHLPNATFDQCREITQQTIITAPVVAGCKSRFVGYLVAVAVAGNSTENTVDPSGNIVTAEELGLLFK